MTVVLAREIAPPDEMKPIEWLDVSLFHGHRELGDDTLTPIEVNFHGHTI